MTMTRDEYQRVEGQLYQVLDHIAERVGEERIVYGDDLPRVCDKDVRPRRERARHVLPEHYARRHIDQVVALIVTEQAPEEKAQPRHPHSDDDDFPQRTDEGPTVLEFKVVPP